jgi:CheY-like chemotaxis protein
MRGMLQRQRMEVTMATNGKEGLDAFLSSQNYEFDLIITDLRMPVMR